MPEGIPKNERINPEPDWSEMHEAAEERGEKTRAEWIMKLRKLIDNMPE